jgi:hypothetical protein
MSLNLTGAQVANHDNLSAHDEELKVVEWMSNKTTICYTETIGSHEPNTW